MVSFSRTHYLISIRRFFARGAYRQEGPTGQRGLLVSGGGFSPSGLPLGYAPECVSFLRGLCSFRSFRSFVDSVCSALLMCLFALQCKYYLRSGAGNIASDQMYLFHLT